MFVIKKLISILLIAISLSLLISCGGADDDTNNTNNTGYTTNFIIQNNSSYELTLNVFDKKGKKFNATIIPINTRKQFSSFGGRTTNIHLEPSKTFNQLIFSAEVNGIIKDVYTIDYTVTSFLNDGVWKHENDNNKNLNNTISNKTTKVIYTVNDNNLKTQHNLN